MLASASAGRLAQAKPLYAVRCGHCNIKRFYKPMELRDVIGNACHLPRIMGKRRGPRRAPRGHFSG
ncbi:hypothetical protein SAMN04488498_1459 [Mesorhizobium albiziae]|uniref:Uncharacterized protein n=1 Tax=Neomesorhizobium albiziae TaxID=335020 RepID=A0A1I4FGP0_9HYPH|nr:hypothetical protein [Mesorhizobium albiziae]GLS32620.1 hypothetical protein GCM10007937_43300 [Mesorhizobium albiziae]SFL16613.1 hypothetical protein SAMN04488498_1459 [Mesorhizobium albiziae]